MNIFEGSRRIAKFLAVAWIIVATLMAYERWNESGIIIYAEYVPTGLNDNLVKRVEECPIDSYRTDSYIIETGSGTKVSVRMCRERSKELDEAYELARDAFGKLDIKKMLSVGRKYLQPNTLSPEEYRKIKDSLVSNDSSWVDTQWSNEFLRRAGIFTVAIVGGLLSLWILTWVIGWIVRGFIDNTKGQDKK